MFGDGDSSPEVGFVFVSCYLGVMFDVGLKTHNHNYFFPLWLFFGEKKNAFLQIFFSLFVADLDNKFLN